MAPPPPPAGDHYFSEQPSSRSQARRIRLQHGGLDVELSTDRGTFSPSRIDPGTGFLLDAAPPPPTTGRFLDLGCGYGPIAVSLALRSPGATVVAVDVNERSRQLCADNAARLGASVTVGAPDDVPDGDFDLIWSNPPIRIGKEALHALLSGWLDRLAPGGAAILVVNRHLGADSLQRWLDAQGRPTHRLASKKGYRLLQVDGPSPD